VDVPPMTYSPTLGRTGMVLFLHAIRVNAPRNLAMSLDHTSLIAQSGSEALSRHSPQLSICINEK
jgi:Xaa-Pro dipeptidase